MAIDRVGGTPIINLCDEDFDLIGFQRKLTDEEFEEVLSRLRDYYNDNFGDVLAEIVEGVVN